MSRLTDKNIIFHFSRMQGKTIISSMIRKLGQIEDILEEYGIEDLTDLKIALDYYDHRFDGLYTERVGNDE